MSASVVLHLVHPPHPPQTLMFAQMVDICHDINTWWTQLVKHAHTHTWRQTLKQPEFDWLTSDCLIFLHPLCIGLNLSHMQQRRLMPRRAKPSCGLVRGCGLGRRERCCVEEMMQMMRNRCKCNSWKWLQFCLFTYLFLTSLKSQSTDWRNADGSAGEGSALQPWGLVLREDELLECVEGNLYTVDEHQQHVGSVNTAPLSWFYSLKVLLLRLVGLCALFISEA